MANTYCLVNPHIIGTFETTLTADNSVIAAKTFYKNLSQHFNNNIPKFYFTIQKGTKSTGKYYHYVVKEIKKKDEVKFDIKPYVGVNNNINIEKFESNLKNFKSKFNQQGGKKSKKSKKSHKSDKSRKIDDSSDSMSDIMSDSSEEFYRQARTYKPTVSSPLYYWWYDPNLYNLSSVFIPTFYSYQAPYLHYLNWVLNN